VTSTPRLRRRQIAFCAVTIARHRNHNPPLRMRRPRLTKLLLFGFISQPEKPEKTENRKPNIQAPRIRNCAAVHSFRIKARLCDSRRYRQVKWITFIFDSQALAHSPEQLEHSAFVYILRPHICYMACVSTQLS